MKLESALARKTKHVAISTGCPARPIGVVTPNLPFDSSDIVAGLEEYIIRQGSRDEERKYQTYIKGVQIGPGGTTLTLIPLSPTI